MRVFIAVILDKDMKLHLKNLSGKLSEHMKKAHYTNPDNYHITLIFIGETDLDGYKQIVKAVNDTAAGMPGFKLTTSGTGSFKRNNRHILYCEIKISNILNELHHNLLKNLSENGINVKSGNFTPHITLAREAVPINEVCNIKTDNKEIEVNSISVMESTRINGKLTYIPRFTAILGGKKSDK